MAPTINSKTKQAKKALKKIRKAFKAAQSKKDIEAAGRILADMRNLDEIVRSLLDDFNEHEASWTTLDELQALNLDLTADEQLVSSWIEQVRDEDIQYRVSQHQTEMSPAMSAVLAGARSPGLEAIMGMSKEDHSDVALPHCSYCSKMAQYHTERKIGSEGETVTRYACNEHALRMPGDWVKEAAGPNPGDDLAAYKDPTDPFEVGDRVVDLVMDQEGEILQDLGSGLFIVRWDEGDSETVHEHDLGFADTTEAARIWKGGSKKQAWQESEYLTPTGNVLTRMFENAGSQEKFSEYLQNSSVLQKIEPSDMVYLEDENHHDVIQVVISLRPDLKGFPDRYTWEEVYKNKRPRASKQAILQVGDRVSLKRKNFIYDDEFGTPEVPVAKGTTGVVSWVGSSYNSGVEIYNQRGNLVDGMVAEVKLDNGQSIYEGEVYLEKIGSKQASEFSNSTPWTYDGHADDQEVFVKGSGGAVGDIYMILDGANNETWIEVDGEEYPHRPMDAKLQEAWALVRDGKYDGIEKALEIVNDPMYGIYQIGKKKQASAGPDPDKGYIMGSRKRSSSRVKSSRRVSRAKGCKMASFYKPGDRVEKFSTGVVGTMLSIDESGSSASGFNQFTIEWDDGTTTTEDGDDNFELLRTHDWYGNPRKSMKQAVTSTGGMTWTEAKQYALMNPSKVYAAIIIDGYGEGTLVYAQDGMTETAGVPDYQLNDMGSLWHEFDSIEAARGKWGIASKHASGGWFVGDHVESDDGMPGVITDITEDGIIYVAWETGIETDALPEQLHEPGGDEDDDSDIYASKKAARYGVWAGGDLLATFNTYEEAEFAAEDVRGDFPDIDVGIDIVLGDDEHYNDLSQFSSRKQVLEFSNSTPWTYDGHADDQEVFVKGSGGAVGDIYMILDGANNETWIEVDGEEYPHRPMDAKLQEAWALVRDGKYDGIEKALEIVNQPMYGIYNLGVKKANNDGPFQIGEQVSFDGSRGTIVDGPGAYVWVLFEGETEPEQLLPEDLESLTLDFRGSKQAATWRIGSKQATYQPGDPVQFYQEGIREDDFLADAVFVEYTSEPNPYGPGHCVLVEYDGEVGSVPFEWLKKQGKHDDDPKGGGRPKVSRRRKAYTEYDSDGLPYEVNEAELLSEEDIEEVLPEGLKLKYLRPNQAYVVLFGDRGLPLILKGPAPLQDIAWWLEDTYGLRVRNASKVIGDRKVAFSPRPGGRVEFYVRDIDTLEMIPVGATITGPTNHPDLQDMNIWEISEDEAGDTWYLYYHDDLNRWIVEHPEDDTGATWDVVSLGSKQVASKKAYTQYDADGLPYEVNEFEEEGYSPNCTFYIDGNGPFWGYYGGVFPADSVPGWQGETEDVVQILNMQGQGYEGQDIDEMFIPVSQFKMAAKTANDDDCFFGDDPDVMSIYNVGPNQYEIVNNGEVIRSFTWDGMSIIMPQSDGHRFRPAPTMAHVVEEIQNYLDEWYEKGRFNRTYLVIEGSKVARNLGGGWESTEWSDANVEKQVYIQGEAYLSSGQQAMPKKDAYGMWFFFPQGSNDLDDAVQINGTYKEAIDSLPAGHWVLGS